MGEEDGIQFNGVARLKARFAEELGGQFQRGDVASVPRGGLRFSPAKVVLKCDSD